MTDNSATSHNGQAVNNYSLTPQDAAVLLGLNLRAVYRLIERGKLISNGAKRGQLLTPESIETYRLSALVDAATDDVIAGQQATQQATSPGGGENGRYGQKGQQQQAATMALMVMQQERSMLQTRLEEMHELRRQDALKIGALTERVQALEADLIAHEAAVQPLPAVEVQTPAALVETPTATQQVGKRSSWWSRMLGNRGKR